MVITSRIKRAMLRRYAGLRELQSVFYWDQADPTKPAMSVAKSRTKWMLGFLVRSENRSFLVPSEQHLLAEIPKVLTVTLSNVSLFDTHYFSIHISSAESSCFVAGSEQRQDEEALWGQTSLRQSCQKPNWKFGLFLHLAGLVIWLVRDKPIRADNYQCLQSWLPYRIFTVRFPSDWLQYSSLKPNQQSERTKWRKWNSHGWEEVRSREARDYKGQGRLQFR